MTDDAGRLLWVEGSPSVRDEVGRIGFVEGAVWCEERVGTNAPAPRSRRAARAGPGRRALHAPRPVVQLRGGPVRDLRSGRILGVLDVTGGLVAASGLVLSLVRASVAAIERELAERGPRGGAAARRPAASAPRLDVLGASSGTLRAAAGQGRVARPVHVRTGARRRHARRAVGPPESSPQRDPPPARRAPAGLGADELAVLLHPGDLSDVTVRAEVSRLRRAVGPLLGGSRPYRLAAPVCTDLDTVRDLLATGDLHAALGAYPGPVLPRSVAPGVERLRDELSAELRGAVLASTDPGAVGRWLASDEGADDHTAWSGWLRSPHRGARRARGRGRGSRCWTARCADLVVGPLR
ncbi:transcriptional regulator [Oerskovia sp. M15]